jgi:hypothetical protein
LLYHLLKFKFLLRHSLATFVAFGFSFASISLELVLNIKGLVVGVNLFVLVIRLGSRRFVVREGLILRAFLVYLEKYLVLKLCIVLNLHGLRLILLPIPILRPEFGVWGKN